LHGGVWLGFSETAILLIFRISEEMIDVRLVNFHAGIMQSSGGFTSAQDWAAASA